MGEYAMNNRQKLLLVATGIGVILMALFPPTGSPMNTGVLVAKRYMFIFSMGGLDTIDVPRLLVQFLALGGIAFVGWLILGLKK